MQPRTVGGGVVCCKSRYGICLAWQNSERRFRSVPALGGNAQFGALVQVTFELSLLLQVQCQLSTSVSISLSALQGMLEL